MITYLFFTGGYDSTYRLCELLVKYKKTVQPIYFSDPNIDNYSNSRIKRRNNKNELNSQEKIIEKILKRFPECKKLLKKTIVIDNIKIDNETEEAMKLLRKKKYVRRARCQYGAMAQYCKNTQLNVELCAEIGGHFEKGIRNRLVKIKNNSYRINSELYPELEIFKYFELPLIKMDKQMMLTNAGKYSFEDILKNTWSCWYPRNGRPCGKCIMCRERIVPYIEEFQSNTNINTKPVNNIIKKGAYLILLFLLFLLIAKLSTFTRRK
jgi:7-cyano-7-deazaguanine synthase in queuosine biosynthesis